MSPDLDDEFDLLRLRIDNLKALSPSDTGEHLVWQLHLIALSGWVRALQALHAVAPTHEQLSAMDALRKAVSTFEQAVSDGMRKDDETRRGDPA